MPEPARSPDVTTAKRSEERQRRVVLGVRVNEVEAAFIRGRAQVAGVSVGTLIRMLLLEDDPDEVTEEWGVWWPADGDEASVVGKFAREKCDEIVADGAGITGLERVVRTTRRSPWRPA